MAKGITPTQRTLNELRKRGMNCAIAEKYVNIPGQPFGFRKDLFGWIDIVALDPKRGIIGIQSTGTSFATHLKKILFECADDVIDWIKRGQCSCGNQLSHVELWGWRKVKKVRGGKQMIWSPRIQVITMEDFNERPQTSQQQGFTSSPEG